MNIQKLNIAEEKQSGKSTDYNIWLDEYIRNHGVDVTASAYQGVLNGTWYDITVGQVFDKSRNVQSWKKIFQNRLNSITNNAEVYQFLKTFTEKALEIGYHF